ncbi:MAG: DUF1049 domain-containing protein [Deltaproteobacteria bacterium]|nr:DUF1049 domain-containing protein [Deltaproteobacteria bacterium]MBW2072903.1 DUF1049 domain-containing protein [Deltaproteobacteria bacterium]
MLSAKRLLFLVLAVLFATFIYQNAEVVQVRFLFWSTAASRALVLVGTFIVGVVVGLVSGMVLRKERRTDSAQAE